MKSLVDLLAHLLLDCGRRSDAPLSRDLKTIRERVKHEGDSFLTITLPNFCRDFERCLDKGRIVPGLFLSFGKKKSGIPEFLQGLLHNVFGQDGVLLDEPSIDCIRCVRQICLIAKKVQRPCSKERNADAIDGYVKVDDGIVADLPGQLGRYFAAVARIILTSVVDDSDFTSEIMPSHGPGATAESISGNQKWVFREWHQRLQDVGFTYEKFGRACESIHDEEEAAVPSVVDPLNERPCKVTLVPKTLKTPRIIAVEPVVMQYAQQGLMRYLVRQLERCRFTSGHVLFRDQSVHQGLALTASNDGFLSTIDLSEASDRVSMTHVRTLLSSVPEFLEWVTACRSSRAKLPSGELIHLKKFASMGSALCFPIESLVFFTSIIASRIHRAGLFPDARTVHSFGRDVYVYGDDLIVPSDEASDICDDLEALGFKVNVHKSFWTGKFRESCGSDCYGNERVTPVYLRRDLPMDVRDVSGILSCVATSTQLTQAGYSLAGGFLRKEVERIVGKLPRVPLDSPAIGWHDYSEVMPPRRWNRDLQRFEYRCLVPFSPMVPDPLDGDPALAKCFRLIGHSDSIDKEHLERSPRLYGLALKRRWVPYIS